MAAGDVMQEYVVKLGTIIDNEGVNQILSFFDSSKMKALGLTAAIAGATTAIYKFVEASTKREFELAKLAKQQHKSIQLTRAENNAMQAMGKTMAEINKDENLKKIYKDIVAFNKELQLPDAKHALDTVRNLEGAFMKLKATINTAVQWINSQILINLERPLERLTGKTQGITEWLRENMKNYAPKIATVLSDFARGVMGIVDVGAKLLEWLNNLPPAIKNVGIMVLWFLALFKGGTIGQILSLIGLVGDVLRDKDNYDWNKEHPGEEVPTLGDQIWGVLEDESLTAEEKASKIATNTLALLSHAMNEAFADENVMSSLFGDGSNGGGGLFAGILNWIDSNNDVIIRFFGSAVNMITRGLRLAGGAAGGLVGQLIDGLFGDGTTSDHIFADEDGSGATAFAGGLGGLIGNVLKKLQDKDASVWDIFKSGMEGFGIGTFLSSVLANIAENQNGGFEIDWEQIWPDVSGSMSSLFSVIEKGIKLAASTGKTLFELISTAFQDPHFIEIPHVSDLANTIGGVLEMWSQDSTLMGGISTTISTLLAGGNFLESIIAGIFGSFTMAKEESMRNFLKSRPGSMSESFIDTLEGSMLEEMFASKGGTGSDMWRGVLGNMGSAGSNLISGIWEVLVESIDQVHELGQTLWSTLITKISEILFGSSDVLAGLADSIFGGAAVTGVGAGIVSGNFWVGLIAAFTDSVVQLNGLDREKIQAKYQELIRGLKTLWYGELDEYGAPIDQQSGLNGFLADILGIDDGSLEQWFADLGTRIVELLTPIFNTIGDLLAISLYNALDKLGMGGVASALGVKDPNYATIEKGKNGYTLKTTNSPDYVEGLTLEQASELAPFLRSIKKGEGGDYMFSGELGWLNDNWIDWDLGYDAQNALNDYINGKIDTEKFRHIFNVTKVDQYVPKDESERQRSRIINEEKGVGDQMYYWGGQYYALNSETGRAHMWGANGEWVDASALEAEKLKTSADALKVNGLDPLTMNAQSASNILPLVTAAAEELTKSLVELSKKVDAVEVHDITIEKPGAGDDGPDENGAYGAYGGRVATTTHKIIGEDGPEYIVPISKPGRAIELINQALSEMGMGALGKVSQDFGIGDSASFGSLGNSLDSLLGGLGGGNTNISAPINIYVTATGADGKEIGEGAYDAAERHLMKTLRGVYA